MNEDTKNKDVEDLILLTEEQETMRKRKRFMRR